MKPDVGTMLWLLGQASNGSVNYWYDADLCEHVVELRGEPDPFRDDTLDMALAQACVRQMNRGNDVAL